MGAHLGNRTSLIDCSFLMRKRGIYYFRRSVPVDLNQFFKQQRIVMSLRTRDRRIAKARAVQMNLKLQSEFDHLRWRESGDTFSDFIKASQTDRGCSTAPLLTEASCFYAESKGRSKPKTFHQSLNRTVRYLVLACGDKPVDTFTRADANEFRDQLIKRGLSSSSVLKAMSIIRAMVNFVCREHDLEEVTAFSSVHIEGDAVAAKRIPVPRPVIAQIQSECFELDDEARWIIALISDSGMRLSEALGLSVTDIKTDTSTSYIDLVQHPWRRLKTRSSTRLIPLVGASAWAVERAISHTTTDRLFPKYCHGNETKSNSASAALNKWLKNRLPANTVIHSFRHSIRDRLRDVECPPEIADAIGGWSRNGVGEKYGEGYSVHVLHKWLKLTELT